MHDAYLKCFRGLDRFLVRTLPKVTCVAFWSAIAYNALKLMVIALRARQNRQPPDQDPENVSDKRPKACGAGPSGALE